MKRILFVLLSAAFVSCSGGRDYNPFGGEIVRVSPEKRVELSGDEVVRLKDDYLDLGGLVFVHDTILVMQFVEREEGHLSAYSLNTGECLGDYIYVSVPSTLRRPCAAMTSCCVPSGRFCPTLFRPTGSTIPPTCSAV